MKKTFKILFYLFIVTQLCFPFSAICQHYCLFGKQTPNKILYGKCTELNIIDQTDSTSFSKVEGYSIKFKQANRDWKEFEYFESKDTMIRDTLIVNNYKFTIDSLTLVNSQYSGAYVLSYAFLTFNKNKKFIILLFFDGYQLGTQMQGRYIIIEIIGNDAKICSSYIENLNYPYSKVKIVKKKSGIILKSNNIDRLI